MRAAAAGVASAAGKSVFGQGAAEPSAVHVVSRLPVSPWTKQMSTVASGTSWRTLHPSGNGGVAWLEGGWSEAASESVSARRSRLVDRSRSVSLEIGLNLIW